MLWERARAQDTITFLSAEGRLQSVARSVVAFLDRLDLLVTPALATRPVRIGEIHGRGPDPWENYQRSGHFTPFTAICNVTGQPAISLPLYHGDDGLPLAVQLIGRPAREDVLLSVAGQLEAALPWAERLAPMAPG
jgi:amidase